MTVRNLFSGIPKEFYIPTTTQVVFVADFFVSDLVGGAELTSEAIIKASPYKLFKLHSSSLTEELLEKNKDKIWVFGNNTMVAKDLLVKVQQLKLQYFFFEYDFKPCILRSTKKHELQSGKPCDCHLQPHGHLNAKFMTGAKELFWCSDGQRDKFYGLFPQYKGRTTDFTQSSTFYPETILNIRSIRERKLAGEIKVEDRWAILDSDSWIKGTEDAVKFCKNQGMNVVLLKNLSPDQFLVEIAKSKGLVFFPRDMDVGSRITTETKLLGGATVVNENVLHASEGWFNQPTEKIEEYLLDGPARFWREINKHL